jgi:hypothetical protein
VALARGFEGGELHFRGLRGRCVRPSSRPPLDHWTTGPPEAAVGDHPYVLVVHMWNIYPMRGLSPSVYFWSISKRLRTIVHLSVCGVWLASVWHPLRRQAIDRTRCALTLLCCVCAARSALLLHHVYSVSCAALCAVPCCDIVRRCAVCCVLCAVC